MKTEVLLAKTNFRLFGEAKKQKKSNKVSSIQTREKKTVVQHLTLISRPKNLKSELPRKGSGKSKSVVFDNHTPLIHKPIDPTTRKG